MLGSIKNPPCHDWIHWTMTRRRSGRECEGEGIKKRNKRRSGQGIDDEAMGRGQIWRRRGGRRVGGGQRKMGTTRVGGR